MITSLRRKVFWSILLSAAGVLLAILLAFNVLRLAQTASKKESILDTALMMLQTDAENEKGRGKGRGGKDRSELLRSVSEGELGVIELDQDGAVTARAGCAEQLDDDTIAAIAAAALADPDGHGSADGWDYKVISNAGSTVVSFLDAASLKSENLQTALLSLAAFAAACDAAYPHLRENAEKMRLQREELVRRLQADIPELTVIGGGAPHILSVSLPGWRSEVLMNFLEAREVFVSKSSACKKGGRSHVLEAMGLDAKTIDGALRIGLSRFTAQEDLDALCMGLREARATLAHR